jgi:uncharacterized protein (DUF58 family)
MYVATVQGAPQNPIKAVSDGKSCRSRATVSYQVRSIRRGAFTLPAVHLRVRSRLGLCQR